jgi:hypothetical protein
MVWTIAPAVSGRHRRQVLIVHGVGLVAGAMTMCFMLILMASGIAALHIGSPPWLRAAAASVLVAWSFTVATGRGLPYPRSHWQVPERWRATLPLKATAGAYGYLLGLGPLTDVVLPTYWLLVGITLTTAGGAAWALLAWVTYASVRAAVTVRGVGRYASTCAADGTPNAAVRPERERALLSVLAVVLLVSLAIYLVSGSTLR